MPPYANNHSRRRRREDSRSGPGLMPPEPLPPWDRERRHGHGYDYGHGYNNGGGRWRESSSSSPFASGSRNSSEFSPRWGLPSFEFRRPPGHGKQGGWHAYQENSPHGYSTPRSGDRFLDDDCFRPSGPQGNSRYGRFHRDNRNGSGQKEGRGRSWENNQKFNGPANTPGLPSSMKSVNNKRSVGNSPARPSHPNSDPSAQFSSKDQADKTGGANGPGVNQGIDKANSLESLDWKPLKWPRSGSLPSRGSGFSYSYSSEITGGESSDVKDDFEPKNLSPVQSPSGDAADAPSAVSPEETASRKKARLGWGEGLAKFEKKKVDVLEEDVTKIENTSPVGNVEPEPTHPFTSKLVAKSPKIIVFSECASPATPSSFACSSSPGSEEKTYGKTADGDYNNFSVTSMPLPENETKGTQFRLEKLELNSITNLSSLLNELLQVDEQFSMDSGFTRSSAFNKLLFWKGDISKALELTETEIDSLENELKLLKGDCTQDGFTRPLPLEVVSSEEMTLGCTLHRQYPRGAHTDSKDEDIDTPGTTTSKFVEPLPTQKPVSPCGWNNSCSADYVFVKSSKTVREKFACDNKKIPEEAYCQVNDAKAVIDDGVAVMVEHRDVCDKNEDNICNAILASNKDTASKASEIFAKLLPSDETDNSVDEMESFTLSCLPADTSIKEKFSRRKRHLKFKERVLSLKYRAFYHLWKEDLHSLALRSHRTKPQKKLDVTSRAMQIGNQKHRPIPSRFASPAGSLSLVQSTEALNFTKKLLSDSEVKIYRSSLKMPAMILDDKEKMSSQFVSSNGLVEDPCAVEKERALINPWITEEKEIFMEKLATLGKDFRKIASFLDHKTIADCIQFYYKNHKSESFPKTKRPDLKTQAKPLSSDTYMLTSEKKWGKEMNSSLDLLGEASVIAAQADEAMKTSKLIKKKSRSSNGVIEAPSGLNVVEDERETAAADLLAGICGSLSSEPVSSCITSSVGPKDCNREQKHQKVGSSVRRPLTPDIIRNLDVGDGDDDTCSAESCGEMDPVDWTDAEKSLFVQAFSSHGKDFLMISQFVRTKTRDQCKVFYSKAQKCLGLETLNSGSCSGGLLGSNDTNGSGSDVEDACVVETCSVGCSDKSGSGSGSGSRMDEDLPHVSPDISKPSSTVADLSTSDGNCSPGQLDHKDTEMEPQLLCAGDNPADVSEGELKQSADCGSSSLANQGETVSLTELPVDLSIEAEMNDDATHNDKPESVSKVQCFQEHYIRKCSNLSFQNVVAKYPQLSKSQDQTNDHASSDTEKACSSGDVKLFGKILRKSSSVDNKATTSAQRYNETANNYLTSGAKLDYNGIVGLENVPVRNYGIWDGSKIQVVSYPTLTESPSALLLAKYPAAFASRSVTFPQTGQQMVQVPVNSSECNLNNACEFSPREYNKGNRSSVDYPIFRSQNGGVPSPFTLDFNQRRNGFEALSSLQSQANGSVNMGVVQGGDLRGGMCAGIMDPVAALQLQYSRGSSSGGHTLNGIVKGSCWGGLGDLGR